MIDKALAPYLVDNFTKAYKDYLIKKVFGNKKLFDEQFGEKYIQKPFLNLVKTFFETLYNFYDEHPSGNYDQQLQYFDTNQKLQDALNAYISVSQGDEMIYGFLKVYGYSIEQLNSLASDEFGVVNAKTSKELFTRANVASGKMYEVVKLDMEANNYWWLKNTATTLRRQLTEDIILINQDRLQYMFDKFFPRKFDASTVREVDNQELIRELDFAMYNKYHTLPYYFWWGKDDAGKKKLFMAPQQPKSGYYSFVVYQNYTAKDVKEEDKQYYL